ncbi:anti-sigmaB factor antagonist [Alkalihalophilus pseudofirmus OF4]|uniref:Anti-sigma factor antagonist n=2 Tax=Alkalihalophilus TaxID=2893060 RepID=D3FXF5_ALKPO|nr:MULTISPECIES: STAS domain-containing protein [Alkalihalophilus]ADC50666.1 anti-sigmaB factor antagonist [Alkalihalophilus pseudofirmus OF4]ERN54647.1 anti-sigma factor antagonist [Alkalihalophilus marmarensis DSM 21297]MCM3488733.1 STAS domain-containing protein [Alkalihalophilus marmarensis]OLS35639.1 anti-anti-sigma factor [Alkalihalophilus pseudofirmus]
MTHFTLSKKMNELEVKLIGDLDIDSTELIEEELLPALMQHQTIIINFEEVPFIDSSGIGLLLSTIQTLNEQQIALTISKVRTEVMDIFEMLQIPEIVGKDIFV